MDESLAAALRENNVVSMEALVGPYIIKLYSSKKRASRNLGTVVLDNLLTHHMAALGDSLRQTLEYALMDELHESQKLCFHSLSAISSCLTLTAEFSEKVCVRLVTLIKGGFSLQRPVLVQKAILCLCTLVRTHPQLAAAAAAVFPTLVEILSNENSETEGPLLASCALLERLLEASYSVCLAIPQPNQFPILDPAPLITAAHSLAWCITKPRQSTTYYKLTNPWLRIRALQLLRRVDPAAVLAAPECLELLQCLEQSLVPIVNIKQCPQRARMQHGLQLEALKLVRHLYGWGQVMWEVVLRRVAGCFLPGVEAIVASYMPAWLDGTSSTLPSSSGSSSHPAYPGPEVNSHPYPAFNAAEARFRALRTASRVAIQYWTSHYSGPTRFANVSALRVVMLGQCVLRQEPSATVATSSLEQKNEDDSCYIPADLLRLVLSWYELHPQSLKQEDFSWMHPFQNQRRSHESESKEDGTQILDDGNYAQLEQGLDLMFKDKVLPKNLCLELQGELAQQLQKQWLVLDRCAKQDHRSLVHLGQVSCATPSQCFWWQPPSPLANPAAAAAATAAAKLAASRCGQNGMKNHQATNLCMAQENSSSTEKDSCTEEAKVTCTEEAKVNVSVIATVDALKTVIDTSDPAFKWAKLLVQENEELRSEVVRLKSRNRELEAGHLSPLVKKRGLDPFAGRARASEETNGTDSVDQKKADNETEVTEAKRIAAKDGDAEETKHEETEETYSQEEKKELSGPGAETQPLGVLVSKLRQVLTSFPGELVDIVAQYTGQTFIFSFDEGPWAMYKRRTKRGSRPSHTAVMAQPAAGEGHQTIFVGQGSESKWELVPKGIIGIRHVDGDLVNLRKLTITGAKKSLKLTTRLSEDPFGMQLDSLCVARSRCQASKEMMVVTPQKKPECFIDICVSTFSTSSITLSSFTSLADRHTETTQESMLRVFCQCFFQGVSTLILKRKNDKPKVPVTAHSGGVQLTPYALRFQFPALKHGFNELISAHITEPTPASPRLHVSVGGGLCFGKVAIRIGVKHGEGRVGKRPKARVLIVLPEAWGPFMLQDEKNSSKEKGRTTLVTFRASSGNVQIQRSSWEFSQSMAPPHSGRLVWKSVGSSEIVLTVHPRAHNRERFLRKEAVFVALSYPQAQEADNKEAILTDWRVTAFKVEDPNAMAVTKWVKYHYGVRSTVTLNLPPLAGKAV
mmetsp:Transcript_48012/g.94261  ORF Transcript_48012/g.94261 Transcript_48012/m.94261 type:complete len:1197 (+) Transcript_48012:355-3945(+)